jgi:DNA-binding transcriptional MerR regulator
LANQDNGDKSNGLLTTGDMARLSGNTLRTVRFYEAEGLISAMDREGASHRRFTEDELARLRTISDLRASGLSLARIKTLIALKSNFEEPTPAASRLGEELLDQIAELDRRIGVLERVRSELSATVAALNRCRECNQPNFPEGCHDCAVVNRPECKGATNLLWRWRH